MRTRIGTIIAGLVLAAALAGGVAYATIPASDGTINGCYRTSLDDQKGQLRIVDDPASCRSNELPIQWNQEGPQGDTGAAGEPGAQGPKGDKGDTGAQGAQGPQGATGATGAQGPQGDKGDTGGIGLSGPQGSQGEPGVNGTNGAEGPKGDKGDPGTNGTNGTNGAVGPQGPQGPPGPGALGVQSIAVPPDSAVPIWTDQRLGTLSPKCQSGAVPGLTFKNTTVGADASPLDIALSHALPGDGLAATRTLAPGDHISWSSTSIASLVVLRHGSPVDAAGFAQIDVRVLNEIASAGACRAILVSSKG